MCFCLLYTRNELDMRRGVGELALYWLAKIENQVWFCDGILVIKGFD